MHNPHVLIIGGGLGGLSLAQGLLKAGISFHVFEKDQRADFRLQGYRIRIGQDGLEALERLLPEDLYKTFEQSCAEVIHGGHRVNAITGEPEALDFKGRRAQHGDRALNADRTVMRNVLLRGIEDNISFGKRFERYELVEDGVIVYFSDGSSAHGSLAVGADGARSRCAKQMLPARELLDTEARAIFGKTLIKDGLFEHIPRQVGQGLCLIGKPDDEHHMKLFCDTMHFQRRVGLDLPADYVYWVLLFKKAKVCRSDAELLSASKEKSQKLSLELTQEWHETCRNILLHQDPNAASTIIMATSRPETQPWPTDGRVTLLGDAAHPMTPVGGAGANAAFKDAAVLQATLQGDVSPARIKKYEDEVREAANIWVAQSAGGAAMLFGMKPIDQLPLLDTAVWVVEG